MNFRFNGHRSIGRNLEPEQTGSHNFSVSSKIRIYLEHPHNRFSSKLIFRLLIFCMKIRINEFTSGKHCSVPKKFNCFRIKSFSAMFKSNSGKIKSQICLNIFYFVSMEMLPASFKPSSFQNPSWTRIRGQNSIDPGQNGKNEKYRTGPETEIFEYRGPTRNGTF